jgi:hypothetical protein
VILNLAVWFGLHVIFPPGGNIDWFAIAICAVIHGCNAAPTPTGFAELVSDDFQTVRRFHRL